VSKDEISCLVVVLLTAIEETMPGDGLKTAETCRLINYMLCVACDCTVTIYVLINNTRRMRDLKID